MKLPDNPIELHGHPRHVSTPPPGFKSGAHILALSGPPLPFSPSGALSAQPRRHSPRAAILCEAHSCKAGEKYYPAAQQLRARVGRTRANAVAEIQDQ